MASAFPVNVQMSKSGLQNPDALSNIQIKSPLSHKYYPVSQFVKSQTGGSTQYYQYF